MPSTRLSSLAISMIVCFLGANPVFGESIILKGHVPAATATRRPLGPIDPNSLLELSIVLRPRNAEKLEAQLKEMYDPSSPQFRHFLTAAQFLDSYGPSETDYKAVLDFARQHNLNVVRTTPSRALVHVRAKAADVERAFNVVLRTYIDPATDQVAYAPVQEPSVDATVPIHAIAGLNNFSPPQAHKIPTPYVPPHPPIMRDPKQDAPSGPFGGKDFRAAYASNVTLTGTGQVVGVLILQNYLDSDIKQYEQNEGLPDVPLQYVAVDNGAASPANDCIGLHGESPMDIEQVIAMAPGLSQVNIYGAPGGGGSFGVDLLDEVLTPTHGEPVPGQVTTSWSISYDKANLYPALAALQARGIGFFAYSGDFGAYDSNTMPFPPADDPQVTSVGGTILTTDNQGHWESEVAWPSSGGGISPWGPADPEFLIPSYQQGMDWTKNGGSSTVRNVPDVSTIAQNVRIVCRGTTLISGGTSAATPLWAAFEALANEQAVKLHKMPLGNINSSVYAIGKGPSYNQAFHDITSGNNAHAGSNNLFVTQTGYDLVTGWGSPNGMGLINALVNLAPGFNCAGLAELIKNLQSQLQTGQDRLHNSISCRGPASFDCVQDTKNIQAELSAELLIQREHCAQ
jgi:subtilase family serine protease